MMTDLQAFGRMGQTERCWSAASGLRHASELRM